MVEHKKTIDNEAELELETEIDLCYVNYIVKVAYRIWKLCLQACI